MVKHSRQSTFARKFAVISVLFASHLSLVFSNAAVSEVPQTKMDCSKLCGNTSIPYPFYLKPCDGHSEFGLECLKNSTLIIKLSDHRYKVLNISPDGIIIDDLRSSCFKNISNFTIQGMRNYAISTSNTIQLSGCRNETDCPLNCNSPALSDEQCTFDKTCCYPLVNHTLWPPGNSNFTLFSRMQCVSFTSWVTLSTTSYYQEEFGLKLEWGLMGNCKTFKCAANASCVTATDIKEGVRCACNDGYKGDGFVEGTGCNREFPENYNKGKSKLVPPLLGSIGAAALIAALYAVVICRCSRENCFLGYAKTEENLAAKEALEQVIFDYEVLRNATADFDGRNLLGKGGFGEVYKGTLVDGRVIAVKKLSERQTTKAMGEFLTEVKLMNSVRHRNLVRLLGCCTRVHQRLLVYEFMPNTSLDNNLFGDIRNHLDWNARFNIIVGTARGLAYLHEDSNVPIVHRDIKPGNILLDDKFHPKIADFGLAKFFPEGEPHVSTRIRGTIGYTAPEYAIHGHLSEKADVYSYGVVVLEILSGRKWMDTKLPEPIQLLLSWAWRLYESNQVLEMVDTKLDGEYPREKMVRVITIALLCTQASATLRPPMSQIMSLLTSDWEIADRPTKPAFVNDNLKGRPANSPSQPHSTHGSVTVSLFPR